jgi:hypothetical protein
MFVVQVFFFQFVTLEAVPYATYSKMSEYWTFEYQKHLITNDHHCLNTTGQNNEDFNLKTFHFQNFLSVYCAVFAGFKTVGTILAAILFKI